MISVTEAKRILSKNCDRTKVETVALGKSLGYILAEPVYSAIDVPSFDNSAMDGYAVSFFDSQYTWRINGSIQAGDTSEVSVTPGEAARIMTGAKMPAGADTVIPQELVEVQGDKFEIFYSGNKIRNGSNVRMKGSQCKQGDLILKKGTRISPGVIGLAASVGLKTLKVFAAPKVAFIVTGNELKEVGEELQEGEIFNSNGPMLEALLESIGISDCKAFKAPDEKEELQELINTTLGNFDILLLSGGISVGDYDFVKECLERAGVQQLYYKIKQRPGKPMFAGKANNKWVFALPGNPASVLSCFKQYVEPCIKHMMGHEQAWEQDEMLPLAEDVKKKSGFTFFMKARKQNGKVKILGGQQSFNLLSFGEADSLVELEEETELIPAGTKVKVYNL